MIYDLLIIGAGPAGLTAAIYAKRANLNMLLLEKEYVSGGQVVNTYEVDNYPGLPGIGGFELGVQFQEHAEKLGAELVNAEVTGLFLEEEGKIKVVQTSEGEYRAYTVILALGAAHKKLNRPGEEELAGMGVSYCATCDGAFFKGRRVAVVGGGDVAAEDALFLAAGCEKVYLIHRRDQLRAAAVLQKAVLENERIECLWDTIVEKIAGEDQVDCLELLNIKTQERCMLDVDGVFIAIGSIPASQIVSDMLDIDPNGYIIAGENGQTNIPGIYVAGDLRTKQLRQIVTAVADGANAVISAQRYLNESKAE